MKLRIPNPPSCPCQKCGDPHTDYIESEGTTKPNYSLGNVAGKDVFYPTTHKYKCDACQTIFKTPASPL